MRLPNSVKIGGQAVRIKRGKLEDAYGQYEHDNRVIWISDAIKDNRVIIETLRHEMLEASLLISGVGWMEKYDQEAVIRCIDEIFFVSWRSLKLQ